MTSIIQSSWVFSLNAVNGVSSSKANLFPSTYLKSSPLRTPKISASLREPNADSSPPNSQNSSEIISGDESNTSDPVKLAFAKAKAYKKEIKSTPGPKQDKNPVSKSVETGNRSDGSVAENVGGDSTQVPVSIRLAMEKAREYKNKGDMGTGGSAKTVGEGDRDSGLEEAKVGNSGDGIIKKRVTKKEESSISSIDFMGLGFSDKKKSRGLPAGLVPLVDTFAEGDLPEVELIVGDSSNFGAAMPLNPELTKEDEADLYKPKVSTWGVFPRPSNISKTFGGGKVIRPGEVLETAEDKAAKEARTRKLLADYKKKMGLTIDPKLKSDCEEALKDGEYLMDLGKLKEALPYFEKVMEDLAFQSELHGLAALQWSICQDSLSRPNEARVMYERLQSHPNVQVSKKARQFMFSFQAMEMMKVTSSPLYPKTTTYQKYFEAFLESKANYTRRETEEVEEGALRQALPYIMFLVSPIFILLLIAVQRGT